METYKDVIVSQPPAMYAQSGYTTHFAVENYKGILLCERPTNLAGGGGGVDSSSATGGISAAPFVPSNPTGNPLGYGPSREHRDARATHEQMRVFNQRQHQTNSSQAISRHRRWLRSFARQMKSMKDSDRQLEVEAAQRAARVREAGKSKRVEQQQQQQLAASSPTGVAAPAYDMHKSMDAHVAATRKAGTGPAAASRKPKWALTEEEAFDAELDIDRDLLDFAENLDYERFISDLEVAEALGVMRDRVEAIAMANNWSVDDIRRDVADDEDDLNSVVTPSEAHMLLRSRPGQSHEGGADGAAVRAALPAAQAVHALDWDSSSTGRGRLLKKAISHDAIALAERLFAASPSLQKIHTRHSLARVLQRCALEGHVDVTEAMLLQRAPKAGPGRQKTTAASPPPPPAADPPAIPEPRVVQVGANVLLMPADAGAGAVQPARILRELQQSKERTQGLPYLYRCPAI